VRRDPWIAGDGDFSVVDWVSWALLCAPFGGSLTALLVAMAVFFRGVSVQPVSAAKPEVSARH
jgi:hypothetical protein